MNTLFYICYCRLILGNCMEKTICTIYITLLTKVLTLVKRIKKNCVKNIVLFVILQLLLFLKIDKLHIILFVKCIWVRFGV